ncbi:MAG TPA: MBL fold metallo-hydrolase [candidate division Zixibacteria bacterium]|nr:MBL fold metallo-hydrolase [candidate division Zixibacteria bacterium]
MAQLSFLGAVGTVTGSRFLLEVDGVRMLIDCGMFQGQKENRLRNWEKFPIPPSSIDHVFLTHAHIDHAGYLPRLCNQGFKGKIHCTRPTADLARIMLKDSAHIQEEDAEWANKKGFSKHKPALPLFTVRDAERCMQQFEPVHYGERLDITDKVYMKFKDAGHLLGSSMADIRVEDGKRRRKILFCGDLGRPARALLRDPTQVYNVDYLVIESTYGNRLHDDSNFREEFIRVIHESRERGGVLIIPSFAVGRTQTVLYMLRELETKGFIPSLPIYVDSPMAIDALDIYERRIKQQNLSSRTLTIKGIKVFRPQQLHICDTRKKSQAINDIQKDAIIISSSGMVTAGRIMHHLINRLPNPKDTVLFVGYQAEGTRGRTMLEGEPTVKIYGQHVPIKAKIENLSGFSGHADYDEMLAYLMAFNKDPENVFIVHGEKDASLSLANKIRKQYKWNVTVPAFGDTAELDL